MTVILTHPDCLAHVTPPGHPEQVARLRAVLEALAPLELPTIEAPLATDAQLRLCHPQAYIDALTAAVPSVGTVALDADTHISAGSLTAARRAAGAVIAAVDMVLDGQTRNAFAATRPPGHHAEEALPMGFCLFGNVALGAHHAVARGLSRVAVVDFDVHHGNGTQALCQDDPRILVVTSQQMPLWPGSGDPRDAGPHGTVLNIGFPPGTGSADFRETYTREVFPRLRAFAPELILVSAGFDAHRADPLANMALEADDFAWVTRGICALAAEICEGRVVSALEGGYNLAALADSAAAHVQALKEYAHD